MDERHTRSIRPISSWPLWKCVRNPRSPAQSQTGPNSLACALGWWSAATPRRPAATPIATPPARQVTDPNGDEDRNGTENDSLAHQHHPRGEEQPGQQAEHKGAFGPTPSKTFKLLRCRTAYLRGRSAQATRQLLQRQQPQCDRGGVQVCRPTGSPTPSHVCSGTPGAH